MKKNNIDSLIEYKMVKLTFDEADFILINIKQLIENPKTVEQKNIAESIRDRILADYDKRIERSDGKTQVIKDHLSKLKETL